jgi:NAD(P)H dehydrogenase (quinone)
MIVYYSRTGNTEKVAEAIAEGARKVRNVNVQVKKTTDTSIEEVVLADGIAFGSPAYFTLPSGPILSLLTELYLARDKFAGKPMIAFATGGGSQAETLETLECILKAVNPAVIQPGIAATSPPSQADIEEAKKLGEKLAKAVIDKTN